MKEDSFEDILRKKLQDYQSAEGVPTWQQMQRRMELYNNAHPELRPRNPIRRRILYGAAAVLLFAAVGVGGYRLSHSSIFSSMPNVAERQSASDYGTALDRQNALQTALKESADNSALTDLLRSAKKVEVIAPQSGQQSVTTLWAENKAQEEADAYSSPSPDVKSQESVSEDNRLVSSPTTPTSEEQEPSATHQEKSVSAFAGARSYGQTGYDRYFNSRKNRKSNRVARKWTVGAFADASTFSSVSPAGAVPRLSSFAMSTQIMDMTATKSDYPIDFTAGAMDHRLPISVGLNVRKYLTPRLGVETGLVYSYLRSQAQIEGAFGYQYTQKVHYLGIPLSLTYSVLDRKRLDFYFIGGVMVEKAISATGQVDVFNGTTRVSSATNHLSANGVLGSVHVGTGFGYNFIDRMGLYVEPSVNYYFRNDNQPITYRTANRWNINIRMGLRYNF